MSDFPEGPGWWQASDGKWYPPEQFSGPPPGPQQPAQPYGYGYGQPTGPKNEPLAVASMVAGIVGIVLVLCCGIGVVGSIAALVMGLLARQRIRESNDALTGDGMATAGVALGGVGIGLFVLGVILVIFTNTIDFTTI